MLLDTVLDFNYNSMIFVRIIADAFPGDFLLLNFVIIFAWY